MPKAKTKFTCQDCGNTSPQWTGQCAQCKAWNSFVEEQVVATATAKNQHYAGAQSTLVPITDVSLDVKPRCSTGLSEFDHVLGGGLVKDSVVLIGGDPGIGKSTIMLQILAQLSQAMPAIYVTGEESLQQVVMRAQRLEVNADALQLLADTSLERILDQLQKAKPSVVVIDSIQTIGCAHVNSAPGSVSQLRECTARLVQYAKHNQVALFLAGHVTKEGMLAGPRVLEHMVDSVLYFEGRSDSRYRVIRAVKNRFGAVNELGVFAMTDTGLKQVSNPSALFLSARGKARAGSVTMATWEGTRPLLVEVQTLVDTHFGNAPRRVTVGLDAQRLSMLLAVLHRHGGVATSDQDVFVNVAGGLRVLETAADLAMVIAVMSSLRDQVLPQDLIVFGELGLSGELRPVPCGQERLKEAVKHGMKTAIIPEANAPKKPIAGLRVIPVTTLQDAFAKIQDYSVRARTAAVV
jgi:DNA repair protein RadA/Sms